MDLDLVQGDITTMPVDAIVNAANPGLLGGGGVDGAIHRAGGPGILAECKQLRATRYPDGLPRGEAVATSGGWLPARWVIHTAGPVFRLDRDDTPILRNCYANSIAVAADLGARTIAFPLISAGIYGWPLDDAVHQAIDVIRSATQEMRATLVLFGADAFAEARRQFDVAT